MEDVNAGVWNEELQCHLRWIVAYPAEGRVLFGIRDGDAPDMSGSVAYGMRVLPTAQFIHVAYGPRPESITKGSAAYHLEDKHWHAKRIGGGTPDPVDPPIPK